MAVERKPVSTRTRFEVFKRDRFACVYCGRTPPAVTLHCDHVLAVANGGTNAIHNLATSCADCNLGKSSKPLESVPETTSIVMADQMERAIQVKKYNQWLKKQRTDAERICNELGAIWWNNWKPDAEKNHWTWGDHPKRSVMLFLKRMPSEKVSEALDIALGRMGDGDQCKAFKYFCAVCWNMIREVEGTKDA